MTKYVLLFSILFFLMACSEDINDTLDDSTDKPKETTLLTVIVPESYQPAEGSFFFITTIEGALLGSAEITESKSTITTTTDITDQQLVLHQFVKNSPLFSLRSYVDFPVGAEVFWSKERPRAGKQLGKANLKFQNAPPHDKFSLSPNNQILSEAIEEDRTYEVNIFENLNEAYLVTKTGNTGAYKLLKNLEANRDYFISLDDMNDNMQTISIDLAGMDAYRVEVRATESAYSLIGQTFVDEYFFRDPFENYDIVLPADLNEYPYFRSFVEVTDPTEPSLIHRYQTSGFMDDHFKKIDAQILDFSTNIDDLGLSASGVFDVSVATIRNTRYLTSDTFIHRRWEVVSKDGKSIRFPQLPDGIRSRFPGFNVQELTSEEDAFFFMEFKLYDYSRFENYQAFIESFSLEKIDTTDYSIRSCRKLYDSRDQSGRINQQGLWQSKAYLSYQDDSDPLLPIDVMD